MKNPLSRDPVLKALSSQGPSSRDPSLISCNPQGFPLSSPALLEGLQPGLQSASSSIKAKVPAHSQHCHGGSPEWSFHPRGGHIESHWGEIWCHKDWELLLFSREEPEKSQLTAQGGLALPYLVNMLPDIQNICKQATWSSKPKTQLHFTHKHKVLLFSCFYHILNFPGMELPRKWRKAGTVFCLELDQLFTSSESDVTLSYSASDVSASVAGRSG